MTPRDLIQEHKQQRWQAWDAILILATLEVHAPANTWTLSDTQLTGVPSRATREDCLRRVLRPHDEAGFRAESDAWMMGLRSALDADLQQLTLLEVSEELGQPYPKLPADVIEAIRELFRSQAFLRYLDAYLYFGVRFLAARDPWKVEPLPACPDENRRDLPLAFPPPLITDDTAAEQFREFSKHLIAPPPDDVAEALGFLDDFRQDVDGDVQLQLEEPEELELWLRGLRPELEADSPERLMRFQSIRNGLSAWAAGRAIFYLQLKPPPQITVMDGQGRITTTRPADGWIVTHPMAARIALLDLYWIARLLRADVSADAFVRYKGVHWLSLLRFYALLHGDNQEAERLSAMEEALRSVFDLACDLIQNSMELTQAARLRAAYPQAYPDLPAHAKKWRSVLDRELEEIGRQRKVRRFIDPSMPQQSSAPGAPLIPPANVPHKHPPPEGWSEWITTGERPRNLIGLAFSGGGVRSATVSLGVLQGLQELDMLRHVDYLSTVSGGGFAGAWLVGNVRRSAYWLGRLTDWKDSIRHLREYANYLVPRSGLLSADTWNMGNSWFRNAFLIQLTGLAWLFVLLLSVLWTFRDFHALANPAGVHPLVGSSIFVSVAGVVALLLASLVTVRLARHICAPEKAVKPKASGWRQVVLLAGTVWVCSLALTAHLWSRALACQGSLWNGASADRYSRIFLFGGAYWWPVLLFSLVAEARLAYCAPRAPGVQTEEQRLRHSLWVALFCTVVLHLAISGVFYLFRVWCVSLRAESALADALAFVTGPTFVLASFALCLLLHIGLVGRFTNEAMREWWTRFGTWVGIVAVLGLLLTATAVLSPDLVLMLLRNSQQNRWLAGIKWTAVAGWFGTILSGLFAGQSSKTEGTKNQPKSPGLEVLAQLGGLFFLISSFVLGSTLLCLLLFEFSGISDAVVVPSVATDAVHASALGTVRPQTRVTVEVGPQPVAADSASETDTPIEEHAPALIVSAEFPAAASKTEVAHTSFLYWESARVYAQVEWWLIPLCWVVALWLGWLFSRYFEINIFGLSQFYKNRLVRAYLGATRWQPGKRHPDPFTKFDFEDDLDLAVLQTNPPKPASASPQAGAKLTEPACNPYRGPFPLFNCTLNLGGSADLALNTRHSASFTLSPLFCGADRPMLGYAPTACKDGSYAHGIRTGQAVAISGAAVSSNMGYNTSPLVAFLLTMFNLRLGWWFPNPSKPDLWTRRSITSSFRYLVAELLGIANEKRGYVNVSDGGHFENLGIYELVRRRCRLIIACDAECDEHLQFGGLGNLLRLCETDFGATIDLDVKSIRPDADGRSQSHCAVGLIKYSSGEIGWLIYLKASVTGDEGVSIAQYRSTHPSFPHETTANQFFTEDQFESYRTLGLHMVRTAFKGTVPGDDPLLVADKLRDMLTPLGCPNSAFLKHTEAYSTLLERLRQSPALLSFSDELLTSGTKPQRSSITPEEFLMSMELTQLMENVFLDLRLDDFWEHPDNRGWAILFMRWARSPRFRMAWNRSHRTYGIRFEHFCAARLGLQRDNPVVRVS